MTSPPFFLPSPRLSALAAFAHLAALGRLLVAVLVLVVRVVVIVARILPGFGRRFARRRIGATGVALELFGGIRTGSLGRLFLDRAPFDALALDPVRIVATLLLDPVRCFAPLLLQTFLLVPTLLLLSTL